MGGTLGEDGEVKDLDAEFEVEPRKGVKCLGMGRGD